MNDNEKILDDLDVTNADEVTGAGPTVDVEAGGQRVGMSENRRGGTDIEAGGVGVSSRETRKGTEYRVTHDGKDVAKATIKQD